MTSEYRIAFKAGRAFRREHTKFVDAHATKGAIILQNGDDGLLHFIWKNRETGENQEDLILFPGDANFVKVPQSTWGRTFVLKFSSSDQIHFFWMQDADATRDAEFVENVNRLLQDPEAVPIWHASASAGSAQTGSSSALPTTTQQPAAGLSATAAPAASATSASSSSQLSSEQMAHLRQILGQGGLAGLAPQQTRPDFLLQDILTPAHLLPLFNSYPELLPALFPFLPPDLPVPPSAEVLGRIVGSPQFRSAVRSMDIALASGALVGFVRALGLPEEAGTGFEAFIRAIEEQNRREGGTGGSGQGSGDGKASEQGDGMDTD